ncbi:MAG: hypothetical protein OHK0038_04750 [Flammeovirgaceae bacterium]
MFLTVSLSANSTFAHYSLTQLKKEESHSDEKNSPQKQSFIKKLEVFSQQADKALVLPTKVIGDFLTPYIFGFSVVIHHSSFITDNNALVLHPALRIVLLFFTAPNAP